MRFYNKTNSMKRGTALFLSCLIFWQYSAPNTIFAKNKDTITKCSITEEELLSSVKEAIKKNKTQNKDNLCFDGDYSEDYEELFGFYDDSNIYRLNLTDNSKIASDSTIKKEKLTAFLKIDTDEDTPADGSEIIFLTRNTTKKTKVYSIDLMGQNIQISVPTKDTIKGESEDINEDEDATSSDIIKAATLSDVVATDSNSTIDNAGINEDIDLDINFYEPVLLNEKATIAFTIPADDFVEKASKAEYSYETDYACITAYTDPDTFDEPVTLEARELDEDEEDSISELLYSQDKLFAGKKSFDIHFLNDDGEEIEPNSEVEVTIKLKEGVIPENADPSTFTVYHMSEMGEPAISLISDEDEVNSNERASLFSQIPAKASTVDGETNITFTTDSFSYYVLSYNGFNQVYAYLYDEEGNLLPGDELHGWVGNNNKFNPTDFCANWTGGYGSAESQNKWISVETLTDVFGSRTSGYNYLDAYTDSDMTNSFKWIYFAKKSTSQYSYTGTWWVSTSETKPTSAPSTSDGTSRKITEDTDGVMKLYIKFRNEITTSDLIDNVEENGCFLAETPENIPEYATLNYKWYRSDDGETYEEVVKKKAANKTYNIEVDENGSKLYPSRDTAVGEKVRRWYKAEAYVNGKLYKSYTPIQVQDYPCIMNGSFETPDIQLMGSTSSYTFPNGTNGLYWQTSAGDKQIEVARAGSDSASGYGCSVAADGNQWVELNAEERGALYQHVLVQPGSTLYWNFSHRGRSGSESMYMVIAPKNLISNDASTDDLVTIAKDVLNGTSGYTSDEGFLAKSVTDGKSSWNSYNGTYTVPEDVWLLSFFFISNSGSTTGNFIDNVSFSTTVPDPEPGYANITVKETVSGLLSSDMSKLSMRVWLEDSYGNIATDKSGTSADKIVSFGEVTDDKGTYTKTINFPNMPDDTEYTVKKELHFSGTTIIPANYNKTGEGYSVIRNNVLEDNGDGSEVIVTAYNEAKDKITVSFNDDFEVTMIPITVSQKLTGNATDKNKEFTFTVSGTLKDGTVITDEISEEDREFTIIGTEEKVIYVPVGSTITITEKDYTDDKYITYYEIIPGDVTKGNKATFYDVLLDKEITFTNKRIEYVITIQKVDEDGNRLKDAKLSLLEGTTFVDSTTTNDASDWSVTLTFGDYTLKEDFAPKGYKVATPINFNIDESGVVTSDTEHAVSTTDAINYIVTMVDELSSGSMIIENTINTKYDSFGTPSFIYEITNNDGSYKKVIMLTMDSLNESEIAELPAGNYTAKQVSVSRYVPETETIEFTVKKGEATTVSFKNTIKQYETFNHVAGIVNKIKEKIS